LAKKPMMAASSSASRNSTSPESIAASPKTADSLRIGTGP